MKTYQVILTVIALLLVNNLALLSFLGHFSEKEEMVSELKTPASSTAISNAELESLSVASTSSNQKSSKVQELTQPQEVDLKQAVEDYMLSDQFAVVLDDWQLKARQRNGQVSARLAKMDGRELHTVTLEAESRAERVMAFNLLLQGGKLKQLSNPELKSLYTELENDHWSKSKLLNVLLENDDPEALDWAKASISNNAFANGSDNEIFNSVYEKDPEFIKRHIEQAEFDPTSNPFGLLSLVNQEPDLANTFYSRHFDKIIDSDNDEVFMFGAHNTNIELTDRQQSKVVELFNSSNRHKRNFAIGLAPNIKDPQRLREAYSSLSRSQEKMIFISSLMSPRASSEISALARELASSSDDPNIQRLINLSY